MNGKRLYIGLLGLIGLLLVALFGGTYAANNLLSQKAASLTILKAKDQALTQQQVSLDKAKRDIAKYAGLQAIAHTVVPEDKDQAEAVREIVNIGAANGITLGSVTFPTSTLGADTTGSSATSTVPTTVTSPNSSANKFSQLVAVKGLPGVYQLTISVASDPQHPATFGPIISFLSGLEKDRRTAQVDSLSLQPVPDNPKLLNFTLTLNEYIKP